MSTATLARPQAPKQQRCELVEFHALASAGDVGCVDRDARVIRGVKVLGLQSRNTGRTIGLDRSTIGSAADEPYSYDLSAMQQALPLFEGMTVRMDHPEFTYKPSGERVAQRRDRKFNETFGRLVRCSVTPTGIVADLEYLASHPLCEMALEAAERMPEKLALSPVTVSDLIVRGGKLVVTEIQAVNSVDLIGATPGTNKSLFESSTNGSPAMDDLSQETTAVAEAPASDPVTTIENAFKVAVMQVLDDDSLDEAAMISRVSDIITQMNAAVEVISGETEAAASEEVPAEEATTTESASLLAENRRLKAREHARELLESAGIAPQRPLVDALAALPDDKARKALIETWPKAVAGKAAPRSAARLHESAASTRTKPSEFDVSTPEKAARILRGR